MIPVAAHWRPIYRLTADGQDITASLQGRLMDLSLTDKRGLEADQLDLTLDDADGTLALPRRGAVLALQLGWAHSGLVDKGQFVVDEVEHRGAPDTIAIRAHAADVRAVLVEKREQSWHAQTLGAIVQAIAQRAGLKAKVADTLARIAIAHIDQADQSDADLISLLARDHDALATVKNGVLLFLATGGFGGQVLLTRAEGDSHRYAERDPGSATEVEASYYDTRAAKKETVTAQAPQAKGAKPSAKGKKVLRHTYSSKSNAQRAATAAASKTARAVASFSLTLARGRPDLIPEQHATVQGFKPEIDSADWLITQVTHRLGDGGYTTEVECELLGK